LRNTLDFAVFSHLAHKTTISIEQRLAEFIDEVELVDSLDYGSIFTTEHHFSGDFSLSPSQSITLTMIATHTRRVRFGPMVVILPISDPLRVAEEMVILDHLSGGRLEVGFGRGTLSHEHKMFGISPSSDRARLDEGIDIILRLWTSDDPVFSFGDYYKYYGVEMPWKPLQTPYPPVWVPGSAGGSSRKWAKRGFGAGAFGLLPIAVNKAALDEYREGWAEGGYPAKDQRACYMVSTYVGESDREAKAYAREHFAHQMALFQAEAHVTRRMNGQGYITNSDADSYPKLVRGANDGTNRHALVCGSPESVAEQIQELREQLGFTMFMGEFAFGQMPYERVAESLKLFSQEVIPQFSHQIMPARAVA
jgi:alkanesulfonate monooxygenase SsuD/methylene tetrahydromethanopterin reductase-like flavin-dependent oxidoreductase (luciferase family)